MKSINFIIKLHVYPFDVMVSIGEDDETLTRKLERHGVMNPGKDFCEDPLEKGRCILYEGNHTLIRLYKHPKTAEDYGVLQHEIFHAVQFLFSRMGFELTKESGEAYAYLIDYLTTEIYKRLK